MPRGRRPHVAPGERLSREYAPLEGDVAIGRLPRPCGQRLESVVALAAQEDLRIPVTGEVVAGDAHAEDLQRDPAVRVGVEARLLAGRDAP